MSNAGPLTTTFIAPPACTTATGLYQIWNTVSTNTLYYYEQGPLASMTSCFPSGYDPVPEQYYSPGLCPSGYTAACSSTDVVSATVTETAYACCPTGAVYTCAASSTPGQQYLGCTTSLGGPLAVAGVTAVSDGQSYPTSTTESDGFVMGANSIAVRFRSGDFSDGAIATAPATTTAPDPAETAPITSSATDSKALSTVGIVGIAAGSAGGALIIASSLGLFLWIRRRKRRARQTQQSQGRPTSTSPKPLLPRGPPPPRPPRPPITLPARPQRPPFPYPPPPPPKDRPLWPSSPTASSTSDFKKHYYYSHRDDLLGRSRSYDDFKKVSGRDTKSTFDSPRGPFELPTATTARSEDGLELHELYGEWPASPSSATGLVSLTSRFSHSASATHHHHHHHMASPRSRDFISPSPPPPQIPSRYWTPTPPPPLLTTTTTTTTYGSSNQPAELESPSRSAQSPVRHRRMPSRRLGSSRTPAELPGDCESPGADGRPQGLL